MSRIRSKDTKPERWLRSELHRRGYRFHVHVKFLPASPDIVFSARRKVIFVHGCFWHRHEGCPKAYVPKSREEYWLPKFERTVVRDKEAEQHLRANGWGTMVVWECEMKNPLRLLKAVLEFLGPSRYK